MVTAAVEKQFFSVGEACAALGVGRTLLYDEIRRGNIRATRLGARRLIPVSEIRRLERGEAVFTDVTLVLPSSD